jgi:CHAT domain-containing protein/Tfp pilus assembly protein PilF
MAQYIRQQRHQEVVGTGRKLLAVLEQTRGPDDPKVATVLYEVAGHLRITGDFTAAKPLYQRALRIQEQTLGPNHSSVALTLLGLADVHWRMGEYANARPLYERALSIQERTLGPRSGQLAFGLSIFADFLRETGDYATARQLFERALSIWQALGPDHPNVGAALNNYAIVLQATGDYSAAKASFQRGLGILERTLGPNHPHVALSLNDFADLLRATGDYPEARRLYERALSIQERAVGPSHAWVAQSLTSLADLRQATGDLAGARPLYERALGIARGADPESRWRASLGLGRIHEREGRLTTAVPLYRESVTTLEQLAGQFTGEARRTQYLQAARRLEAYDSLARLLLRLHEQDPGRGYAQEAWAVLDAKRGRLVGEAMAAARPNFQDAQIRDAAQKAQAQQDRLFAIEKALREEQAKPSNEQLRERVENLTTLLAQSKAEYLSQVQVFLARYPQYKALFADQYTVHPKALAKFADRLPTGTLAVQYFAAPDALYLFVVAPGGNFQVKRRAVSQAELYALVRQYRQHLKVGELQPLSWADDGTEVYRREVVPLKVLTRTLSAHLLEPIEAELAAHSDLVLIPNDLLLYLPIHALTRPSRNGMTRFLAETHAVSYLTQLELVDLLTASRPAPSAPLLALANPDGSLPGASEEVHALLRVRSSVTILEGPRATKAQFLSLAAEFSDLHLATHGVLDPKRPELSYLLMAGPDDTTRRLGIGEIAGLSLRTTLAVLSACDTALGEQVPGAALITLAAAFSQAGAQSIVASLWKVSDDATRDFMMTFHRATATARLGAALQKAQLVLLAKPTTAHPFYWAPFILIGAR